MTHGTESYFLERARASRRVSLITLALASFSIGLLGLARVPVIERALAQTARFGYEGRDTYVRRIRLLQIQGAVDDPGQVPEVIARIAFKGGAVEGRPTRLPTARPATRPQLVGPGDAEVDLISRRVTRLAHVPVVRSEELVISFLVRPEYPEALLEKNIEGKVTVQALVDTIGNVVDVQVLASTGQPMFERAAETAVWQCRFRPYRTSGQVSEVYALFRFAFTIY
jgi:TonB family protein